MPDRLDQIELELLGEAVRPSGSRLDAIENALMGEEAPLAAPAVKERVLSPLPLEPPLTPEQMKMMEYAGIPVTGVRPTEKLTPFLGRPVTGLPGAVGDPIEALAHLAKGVAAFPLVGLESAERLAVAKLAGLPTEEALKESEKAGEWLGPGPATGTAEVMGRIAAVPHEATIAGLEALEEPTTADDVFMDFIIEDEKAKEPLLKVSTETARQMDVAAKTTLGTAVELGLYALIGRTAHKVFRRKKAKPTVADVEAVATEIETVLREQGQGEVLDRAKVTAQVKEMWVPKVEPKPEAPTAPAFLHWKESDNPWRPWVAQYRAAEKVLSAKELKESGLKVPETPEPPMEKHKVKAKPKYTGMPKELEAKMKEIDRQAREAKAEFAPEKPKEKTLVTVEEIQNEGRQIVADAADLSEVHYKMQELTTRYEEHPTKGFKDHIELDAYREWGDDIMMKVNDARRKAGLIEEPNPEAPVSAVIEGERSAFVDPTGEGGFGTRKAAEFYQSAYADEVGRVVENPYSKGKYVFESRPTDVTLEIGGFQTIYEGISEAGRRMAGRLKAEFGRAKSSWDAMYMDREGGFIREPTHLIEGTELGWPAHQDVNRYAFGERARPGQLPRETGWLEYTDTGPNAATPAMYVRAYSRLSEQQVNKLRELSTRTVDITAEVFDPSGELIKSYNKESFHEFLAEAGPRRPEVVSFGGVGEFQKMYENFVARFKKGRATEGRRIGREALETLDRGEIVSQRRVKGRLRPPVYRAELEILKEAQKLPQTWFHRGFENPIRTFREAGGEPMLDMTTHPYHAREKGARILTTKLKKSRQELKRGVTRKEQKRIMAYAYGREEHGPRKLKYMGVEEVKELTPKETAVYESMRGRFEGWYRRLNRVREHIGQEPFPKTENYVTFLRDLSWLERAGFEPMHMPTDILNSHFIKMGSTPFPFEKPRSATSYRLEMDPFRVLEVYENTAARYVQMSPLVAKVREYQARMKDPETGRTFLLANENPVLAASLQSWGNAIAGMKSPTFKLPVAVERFMTKVNNNLVASILGANARSAMIQVTALRNTVTEIGPAYTTRGILSLVDPSKRNFAMQKSKVLLQRSYDIAVDDALRGIRAGAIGEVQKFGTRVAMKPLQILDLETAKATWHGGYHFAMEKLKLSEPRARVWADDMVTRTQASGMIGDLAPVQRPVAGRFLTLFQTFTINDWDFFIKDVVGRRNAGVNSRQAFVKAMRYVAATTAFNILMEDVLKINSPFPTPIRSFRESLERGDDIPSLAWNTGKELIEPIPIVGAARYGKGPGGPGFELLQESVKFMSRDPMRRAWWELGGKWLGVPGTAQTGKMVRARKRGETPYGQVVGTYTPPERALKGLEGLEGLTTMP